MKKLRIHDNKKLTRLYQDDQSVRKNINPENWKGKSTPKLASADKLRLTKVCQMIKDHKLKTGADFLHGAMIFQHGNTPEDFAMAYMLALRAVDINYSPRQGEVDPKWLAAAAKDRWLVTMGQPQDFGMQYKMNGSSKPKRYPINPDFTDKERSRWNVPPLDT